MDNNSTLSVTATDSSFTYNLQPGEFRIFGNGAALATNEVTSSAKKQTLTIVQNPVSNGQATIRYTNAKGGTVYLYDLNGKMLKTQKVKQNSGDETISVSGLQSGVYLLMLKSELGMTVSKLLIK